jgi:AcrR family transcriptional regulator
METLRADARENRERILGAARQLFGEVGLDVSMNEVARRAGVGVATLFRRFPTREDLIAASFADRMVEYAALADTALSDPDPWHGFCVYVEAVCSMQSADRGFTEVLTQSFPTAEQFEVQRAAAFEQFTQLIARAKAAGGLREDFVAEDLPMLLMANAGVIAATHDAAPETSARLVGYLLQAFSAQSAAPLPKAPTPRRMYRSLRRPRTV